MLRWIPVLVYQFQSYSPKIITVPSEALALLMFLPSKTDPSKKNNPAEQVGCISYFQDKST